MTSKSHMGNHVASFFNRSCEDRMRTAPPRSLTFSKALHQTAFHHRTARLFPGNGSPQPRHRSRRRSPASLNAPKAHLVPSSVRSPHSRTIPAEHFLPLCRKYPRTFCRHGMVPEGSSQNPPKCSFFVFTANILNLKIYHRTILKIVTILSNIGRVIFLHFSRKLYSRHLAKNA